VTACPLCQQHKGKRACPAKGDAAICAACCGQKRRIEIDCPESCSYLSGAHAGAWEGRETERRRDLARLAPYVQPMTDSQAQLFFVGLAGLTGIRARHAGLDDRLLHDALLSWRKTLETRAHGLIYEHPPEDARALGLSNELQGLFEARTPDGVRHSPAETDLVIVVRALEQLAAEYRREGGALLELAGRFARQMGSPAASAPGQGSIIVQP